MTDKEHYFFTPHPPPHLLMPQPLPSGEGWRCFLLRPLCACVFLFSGLFPSAPLFRVFRFCPFWIQQLLVSSLQWKNVNFFLHEIL